MLIFSTDPSAFLERAGAVPTRRGPVARLDFGCSPLDAAPLAPPFPAPEAAYAAARPASPDRITTFPWPPFSGDNP